MYEALATQGRDKVHTGLAGIDSSKLKKLRSTQLRECFSLIDEMRHKLEFVARIKGISFIDDAASRTPLSTWYALETIDSSVIWIANGASMNNQRLNDLKRLRNLADRKVKMIICLGDSTVYKNVFGETVRYIVSVDTMREAVNAAFYSNMEDVKILFSPALENGVSFEIQGESFQHEVNEI